MKGGRGQEASTLKVNAACIAGNTPPLVFFFLAACQRLPGTGKASLGNFKIKAYFNSGAAGQCFHPYITDTEWRSLNLLMRSSVDFFHEPGLETQLHKTMLTIGANAVQDKRPRNKTK